MGRGPWIGAPVMVIVTVPVKTRIPVLVGVMVAIVPAVGATLRRVLDEAAKCAACQTSPNDACPPIRMGKASVSGAAEKRNGLHKEPKRGITSTRQARMCFGRGRECAAARRGLAS